MKAPRYPNYFEQVAQSRSYFKHLEKLDTIRTKKHILVNNHTSLIDNVRSMRSQSIKFDKTERNHVIQRDNEILLEHIVKIGIRDNAKGISGMGDLRKSVSPTRSKKIYMKKAEEDRIKAENAKFAQRLLQVDVSTNREWESKMLMHQRQGHDLKKMLEGGASYRHKLVARASSVTRRDTTRLRLPPLGRESYAHAQSFTNNELEIQNQSGIRTPNMVLNDSALTDLSKPEQRKAKSPKQELPKEKSPKQAETKEESKPEPPKEEPAKEEEPKEEPAKEEPSNGENN